LIKTQNHNKLIAINQKVSMHLLSTRYPSHSILAATTNLQSQVSLKVTNLKQINFSVNLTSYSLVLDLTQSSTSFNLSSS